MARAIHHLFQLCRAGLAPPPPVGGASRQPAQQHGHRLYRQVQASWVGLQRCEIEAAIEEGGSLVRCGHDARHCGDLGRTREVAMQGVHEQELTPALPPALPCAVQRLERAIEGPATDAGLRQLRAARQPL
jgi:hypothetical protein